MLPNVGLVQDICGIGLSTVKLVSIRSVFVSPEMEDVYQGTVANVYRILPDSVIFRRGQIKYQVSFDGFNIF